MSYSSLYAINKNYRGKRIKEYSNSWLFSPMVWDVLEDKYLEVNEYGKKPSVLMIFGARNAWSEINDIMNNSDNTCDRVCWELSNQNIFYTKDKDVVVDSIIKFIKLNENYGNNREETGEKCCPLKKEHIIERFKQIAEDIKTLEPSKHPFFVLKNTSVDDTVECWFERNKTLKDLKEHTVEFVNIQDAKIIGFTDVAKYFKG